MKIGGLNFTSLRFGATAVTRLRRGAIEIWARPDDGSLNNGDVQSIWIGAVQIEEPAAEPENTFDPADIQSIWIGQVYADENSGAAPPSLAPSDIQSIWIGATA